MVAHVCLDMLRSRTARREDFCDDSVLASEWHSCCTTCFAMSATAAKQLASRGRRRVQGLTAGRAEADRKPKILAAFLAASRNGDFDALLALLDPDVVLRAGATAEVEARFAVAATFKGRACAARLALVNGAVAAA